MNFPYSKFIVPVVVIAIVVMAAMFILPIMGAILIGGFALSGLLWLSGKFFGFFQGNKDYSDNPSDQYWTSDGMKSGQRTLPKKWEKTEVVDAEIIEETKNRK